MGFRASLSLNDLVCTMKEIKFNLKLYREHFVRQYADKQTEIRRC